MRRSLIVSLLLFTACIVEAPTKDGVQGSGPKAPPAPPAEVKSGANFGDSFELTNAILNPSRGTPGESVRVLMNFKVNKPPERDYGIFVHIEDVDGRAERFNVDHAPRKPTSQWQAGEVVQDMFEIAIPPTMQVRGLTLFVGFWDPQTNQRLPIVNKEAVPNDGRDRLIVARFPVMAGQ